MSRHPWLGTVTLATLLGAATTGCMMADGDDDDMGYAAGERATPPPPPSTAGRPDAGSNPACEQLPQQPITLYQSADDSNSMASPVMARALIRSGDLVETGFIRTYEFLNYYGVRYQSPAPGQLSVVPQLKAASNGEYALQVGVQATTEWRQRPVNLTFVLDTSGSMGGEPIDVLKAAVRAAASRLQSGDIVSLVTWNTEQLVALSNHVVQGPNDSRLLSAIDALQANGGTDLEGGLQKGYELAQRNYSRDRLNRVVLISDGWANVGVTTAELIAKHSHSADNEGIYMVGIAVSQAPQLSLIDTVTDKGRGASLYLDSEREASLMLGDRFSEVMEVAWRSVRLELTLPWYMEMQHFYGEESSTNAREIEPQHLAPGQAMVFAQILKPCSATVVNPQDPLRFRVTFQTPLTHEDQDVVIESTLAELQAGATEQLDRAAAIIAYAEALKKQGDRTALDAALAKVEAANPARTDPALNEIADLIRTYRSR